MAALLAPRRHGIHIKTWHFRTEGAQTVCTIRSYLATFQKRHFALFSSLVQVFKGNVTSPRFSVSIPRTGLNRVPIDPLHES